jgi:hypothetical protein
MVMVLFFVMAMVAAYTNRNLLYEQRMSINNFRATAGMAAADAGIDWTIAMLSGARVNSNCIAPAAPAAADVDFRNRYTIFQADGTYAVPKQASGAVLSPSCVFTDAGWNCKCPDLAAPGVALDYPSNTAPIFAVEIDNGGAPGLLTVDVRGSHEASYANSFGTLGNYNRVRVNLALARALPMAPVAALTAGRNVDMETAIPVKVANPDPKSAVTVHTGAGFLRHHAAADLNSDADVTLLGPPGSSSDTSIASDATLSGMVDGAAAFQANVFQSVFGMDSITYSRQPAAVFIDCSAGCTSASIATAVANNPGRVIWIDGAIDLNSDATFGSVAQPLMLVATGDITLSAQLIVNGFIYSGRDVVWNAAAGSLVRGAVMASRDFVGNTSVAIAYDADVMQRISLGYGSFVRVPGTWHVVPGK